MWSNGGMARPLRVNLVDGWYHVMHRGIERRRIFIDRREYFKALEFKFFRQDADGDGRLTPAELKGVKLEDFQSADPNADGKLDLNEYIDARWIDFDVADENPDGLLTLDEVKGC